MLSKVRLGRVGRALWQGMTRVVVWLGAGVGAESEVKCAARAPKRCSKERRSQCIEM